MTRGFAAVFVAAGRIVGGWFSGTGFAHSRQQRFVVVKSLSERNV